MDEEIVIGFEHRRRGNGFVAARWKPRGAKRLAQPSAPPNGECAKMVNP